MGMQTKKACKQTITLSGDQWRETHVLCVMGGAGAWGKFLAGVWLTPKPSLTGQKEISGARDRRRKNVGARLSNWE